MGEKIWDSRLRVLGRDGGSSEDFFGEGKNWGESLVKERVL